MPYCPPPLLPHSWRENFLFVLIKRCPRSEVSGWKGALAVCVHLWPFPPFLLCSGQKRSWGHGCIDCAPASVRLSRWLPQCWLPPSRKLLTQPSEESALQSRSLSPSLLCYVQRAQTELGCSEHSLGRHELTLTLTLTRTTGPDGRGRTHMVSLTRSLTHPRTAPLSRCTVDLLFRSPFHMLLTFLKKGRKLSGLTATVITGHHWALAGSSKSGGCNGAVSCVVCILCKGRLLLHKSSYTVQYSKWSFLIHFLKLFFFVSISSQSPAVRFPFHHLNLIIHSLYCMLMSDVKEVDRLFGCTKTQAASLQWTDNGGKHTQLTPSR